MLTTIYDVEKAAKEIREYQRMIDEITVQMDDLKNQIKEYMGDETELIAGEYKIKWTPVSSNRFDQKSFKDDHPDIFEMYQKVTESRRFTIG